MDKTMKAVLTCLSCAGVLGVGATAIYDTNKHNEDKLTIKEYTKRYWKDYIPTIIVGTTTLTAIVTNHILTTREIKNLSAAAAGTLLLLNDYKSSIRDTLGDEAYQTVVTDVARRREDGIQVAQNAHVFTQSIVCSQEEQFEDKCDTLFYDEFSDTWFRSSLFNVKNAMYLYNRNYMLSGNASLDLFYEFLGIETNAKWPKDLYGFGYGFMEQGLFWVDFNLVESASESGEKCYVIYFQFSPDEWDDEEQTYGLHG